MKKSDDIAAIGQHLFERAGLGKAPFRFTGVTENVFIPGAGSLAAGPSKPGGCCDYCFTGIRDEFHLASADGKTFKVGCNCIEKAGDAGLIRAYKTSPQYRKLRQERANVKKQAVLTELKAILAGKSSEMAAKPHPMGFDDRKTGKPLTLLDWAQWMFNNCGASGRETMLRRLRKELAL